MQNRKKKEKKEKKVTEAQLLSLTPHPSLHLSYFSASYSVLFKPSLTLSLQERDW
jgi:hypothetical protein